MSELQEVGIFGALAMLAYHAQFLWYARRIFPAQEWDRRWIFPLAALDTVIVSLSIWQDTPLFSDYVVLFLVFFIESSLLLNTSFQNRLLFSGIYPLLLLCVHGILIPLAALLFGENMSVLVPDRTFYLLSISVALLICIGLVMLQRRLVPDERMRLLMRCRAQKRLVCGSLVALLTYLLVESFVYYNPFPTLWTPIFHLITSMVALAGFYAVLWYAADVSAYIEYELKTHQIEKQLQRQVVHYQQYTRYIADLRTFKHDCKRMVNTASRLLSAGKSEEAQQLLGQMNEEMESSLRSVRLSDRVVVDAILQECAQRCQETGIAFSGSVNLTERVKLNDLALCRIFGNLTDNAFEACERLESGRPFISFASSIHGDWVTVEVSNAYAGALILDDGLPTTSKRDSDEHGLGLHSVRQLVEGTGGFLQIDLSHSGVFIVRLHFCTASGR